MDDSSNVQQIIEENSSEEITLSDENAQQHKTITLVNGIMRQNPKLTEN